jgi:hypothetical protein
MQRSASVGLAAALAAFLFVTTPAAAQELPKGGMTANEIAAWLKRGGFKGDVKPDTTTPGDQVVSTTTDGVDVDVYLYQCSGDGDGRRCQSIQYAMGWSPQPTFTADKANAWNASKRYIKAYITPKGSLFGEYDLDVSPGGTYEMLDDSLVNWRTMLTEFKKFFSP